MHHRAEYVPAPAYEMLASSSPPEFVNDWAVPAAVWLTQNEVTEMAERSSTFWDMGWLAAPSAYLDELAVRATEVYKVKPTYDRCVLTETTQQTSPSMDGGILKLG